MLLDLGWSEILLIGVVALVVIGPKDLPKAMRIAGYWIRKARSMSHEFQMNVERMIHEAELDEVRQELKKATEIDVGEKIRETVDPDGSLAASVTPPELPDFTVDEQPPPERTEEAAASGSAASPAPAADAPAAPPPEAEPGDAGPPLQVEAWPRPPAGPPPAARDQAQDAAHDVASPKP
jgi:sec-independent protein translocase protein TatB